MIVAGIGYRQMASSNDILAVIQQAMTAAAIQRIDSLAIPAFKSNHDSPQQAADALNVDLHVIDNQSLQGVANRCVTRTKHKMPGCGYASVAEASALAAAGSKATLIQTRVSNEQATCALAGVRA